MTNTNIIYIAIYRALECLEQENQNDDLSAYLDKANPYVFVDRKSADPSIYADFQLWYKKQNNKNSYEVAKKYLDEKTEFGTLFNDITEAEWDDLVKLIEEEESNT